MVSTESELFQALADNTEKIIIQENIELNNRIVLAEHKTTQLILDLNGHTLSLGKTLLEDVRENAGLICVYGDNSKLTIEDSSAEKTGLIDTITGNDREKPFIASAIVVWADDNKGVSLEVNGGTFKAINFAITGNGTCTWENASSIIINGGIYESAKGCSIYNPQNGSLTVNGGVFTGAETAIEIRGGSLNITNGKFTSTATSYVCEKNSNGTTIKGAAVAVSQHTTKLPINVEITGGEFNGIESIIKENVQGNPTEDFAKVKVEVKGGKFSTDPSALVAEGYKAVKSASSWIVSASN